MRDCFTMWKNTRMLVYVAITAALYAGLGIPSRMLMQFIPGFTDVRPAVVIPVVCSFLFGPAAAWGAGFGNLIADFFGGQFGVASAFGFLGNFLLGVIPYKVWRALHQTRSEEGQTPEARQPWTIHAILAGALACVAACAACGVMIAWGVHLLGLVPFPVLALPIAVNNIAFSALLGWPLLAALYPRLSKSRMLYSDVMDEPARPQRGLAPLPGAILVIAGSVAGLCVGSTVGTASVVSIVAPFLAVLWVGVILL